jgi:hypothetical protein
MKVGIADPRTGETLSGMVVWATGVRVVVQEAHVRQLVPLASLPLMLEINFEEI